MTPDAPDFESVGARIIQDVFPEQECWYEVILCLWRTESGAVGGEGMEVGNHSAPIPDHSKRIPNFSVVGVRRTGKMTLEFYLYKHSNGFEAIEKNPSVGLFIPRGPEWMDLYIDCALKGYGLNTSEIELEQFVPQRSFPETVPFPTSSGKGIIASVQSVDLERKMDRYGTIARKCVRVTCIGVDRTGSDESSAQAYSRTDGLIIEALVPASRYLTYGKPSFAEKMEEHLKLAERLGGELTRERVRKIRALTYSSSRIE